MARIGQRLGLAGLPVGRLRAAFGRGYGSGDTFTNMKLIQTAKRVLKKIKGDRWEVRRCLWPYPEGYATYNPATQTILDTGLTKVRAQEICDQLNSAP